MLVYPSLDRRRTRQQQPAPSQQQLQELKQQYAETTRALEQRIAALEQQIEKDKAGARRRRSGHGLRWWNWPRRGREAPFTQSRRRRGNVPGRDLSEPTYDLLQEADQEIEKLQQQVEQLRIPWIFSLWLRAEQRRR